MRHWCGRQGIPQEMDNGPESFKWNKQTGLSWQNPGFTETERDPVVCVSWRDASLCFLAEWQGASTGLDHG